MKTIGTLLQKWSSFVEIPLRLFGNTLFTTMTIFAFQN